MTKPHHTSPIRFSGSRKFSLDYEVESAGRAGVEEVELWGSTNRGQTWKRWGADPDRQSPFDIETNNDGTYGFCIVVVSKNGLATPRPLEQSSPDVFVVVDTVKPQTRITGASYGEGDQTGALLIRYECLDDNLGSRPIALSFSDSFHGPWTTIAAGLENRGGYAWPADPQLPRQIYLRIDAADQARQCGLSSPRYTDRCAGPSAASPHPWTESDFKRAAAKLHATANCGGPIAKLAVTSHPSHPQKTIAEFTRIS